MITKYENVYVGSPAALHLIILFEFFKLSDFCITYCGTQEQWTAKNRAQIQRVIEQKEFRERFTEFWKERKYPNAKDFYATGSTRTQTDVLFDAYVDFSNFLTECANAISNSKLPFAKLETHRQPSPPVTVHGSGSYQYHY